jgi:hypothetical protein
MSIARSPRRSANSLCDSANWYACRVQPHAQRAAEKSGPWGEATRLIAAGGRARAEAGGGMGKHVDDPRPGDVYIAAPLPIVPLRACQGPRRTRYSS